MNDLSYWRNPSSFFKKAGPGALFFVVALLFLFFGSLIPGLLILYKIGLVILGFLFLLVVIWIIFSWHGI